MPNVFCYWDSSEHADTDQPHMLRLFVRSWSARGFSPRILTVRNAEKHPRYEDLKHDYRNLCMMAAEAAKVKWVCPVSVLNFSLTPSKYRKLGVPAIRRYMSAGWEGAALVDFENCHPDAVLECGRSL